MNTAATHPQTGSLNLGMIGNCAYSALVDQQSRIVWCCLPRFDGDPVFNALLDPGENGSLWAFDLEDYERSEQSYEPNTAVLRTQLFDRSGQGLEITDFAPRFFSRSRYFRPMLLVRRIRPLKGMPRIRVTVEPRFGWGEFEPVITRGSNHVRYVGDSLTLRLNTDAPISYVLGKQTFVLNRELNFLLVSVRLDRRDQCRIIEYAFAAAAAERHQIAAIALLYLTQAAAEHFFRPVHQYDVVAQPFSRGHQMC